MQDIPELGLPPLYGGYYEFGKRYRLGPNGVFVFGSNRQGIHGKGAAKLAHLAFGAQFGVGEGYTGRAYAIPTKNTPYTSLSIDEIEKSVDRFKSVAEMACIEADPDIQAYFYVTPVGTGLAGFAHEQIAPLFQGCAHCWFPDIWKPWLGPYPGIRKEYQQAFIDKHGYPD